MIIRAAILFFLVFVNAYAQAQYFSTPLGRFSVSEKKGCAPFTVTFSVPEANSIACTVDYLGDGNFVGIADGSSFTYTTPGTYTVSVVFGASGGSESIQIEVTEDTVPIFEMYTCGGNQVQLNITDTNYDQYYVDFNEGDPEILTSNGNVTPYAYSIGGPQAISVRGKNNNAADNCSSNDQPINVTAPVARKIIQLEVRDNSEIVLDFEQGPAFQHVLYQLERTVNNGTTFGAPQKIYNTDQLVIQNLDPENNYYCFRLSRVDPCNGTISQVGNNIICSADLNLVTENNNNQLTWSTSNAGGLIDFVINKNPTSVIPHQSNTVSVYNDTDIRCGTEYAYRLISDYGSGITSISKTKTGTAVSNDIPVAINNISTLVNENSVILEWLQDPAFTADTYTIYKSPGFTQIGTASTPTFTDTPYDIEQSSCYKISYEDICNHRSPLSNEICPITLTYTLANNSVNLSWNSYNGYQDGPDHYTIEKYSTDGTLLNTTDVDGSTTSYTDTEDVSNNDQIYFYRIVAHPVVALNPSVSNMARVIKSPNIRYPTAFVPGSINEENKTFKLLGRKEYKIAFELRIFNRWGELLFITTDVEEGWDGTFKGNRMPEGTYVFQSKFTDQAGRVFENAGTVVLLRK